MVPKPFINTEMELQHFSKRWKYVQIQHKSVSGMEMKKWKAQQNNKLIHSSILRNYAWL